jgi:hypothetical protein
MFEEQYPRAFWAIVLGPPLFILAFVSVPRLIKLRRQKRREAIALEPAIMEGVDEYFRLDPYVKQSPADFSREDQAHEKVLQWLRGTEQPLLFLSGVSGAGKSSVLQGYVLPKLKEEGWRIDEISEFTDPLGRLQSALAAPRRRGIRLLVVFDQFEEFIILEGQKSTEEQHRLLARLHEFREAPLPAACLLFAFRSEYYNAVVGLDLTELGSRSTYIEIAPFERGAARRFLERAPQHPSTMLVNRMLDGADALDDMPGLYRPVVLNMFGLALRRFDQAFTGRAERIIQAYLAAAISDKPIREIAPRIIKEMITNASTKQVQSVTSVSTATRLRKTDVTACLNRLAARGLARRVGEAAGMWELSHDFVARQFALLLGRLRPNPWRRFTTVVITMLFTIVLGGAVFGVPTYLDLHAARYFGGRGIALTDTPGELRTAIFSVPPDDTLLVEVWPYLRSKGIQAISIPDGSKLTSLPPLEELPELTRLEVTDGGMTTLPELRGLKKLETISLNETAITTLPALTDLKNLKKLEIVHCGRLTTLPPLQDLPHLEFFRLNDAPITSLPEPKNLPELRAIILWHLRNLIKLPPLRNLPKLEGLKLVYAPALTSVGELKNLPKFKILMIKDARSLHTLPPLQDLLSLETLDLEGTNLNKDPELKDPAKTQVNR